MKRWWLVLGLMLSVGMNLGLLASRMLLPAAVEQPPDRRPDGPPGRMANGVPPRLQDALHRMADELGVEGEDRETFFALHRTFFRRTFETRREVERLEGALRHELTSPEPDRAAIDDLLDELVAAKTGLERAFVDNLLDVRELLGPEEERRYMHFMARMHPGRGGPRGGPRGPRGGPPEGPPRRPGEEGFRPRP